MRSGSYRSEGYLQAPARAAADGRILAEGAFWLSTASRGGRRSRPKPIHVLEFRPIPVRAPLEPGTQLLNRLADAKEADWGTRGVRCTREPSTLAVDVRPGYCNDIRTCRSRMCRAWFLPIYVITSALQVDYRRCRRVAAPAGPESLQRHVRGSSCPVYRETNRSGSCMCEQDGSRHEAG